MNRLYIQIKHKDNTIPFSTAVLGEKVESKLVLFQTNLQNTGLISADRSNKGYSTAYNTPFLIQVVCKRFISFSLTTTWSLHSCTHHAIAFATAYSCRLGCKRGSHRRLLAWILAQRRSAIIRRMVASPHWLFNQEQIPIIRFNCSSRTRLNYYCNNTSSVG